MLLQSMKRHVSSLHECGHLQCDAELVGYGLNEVDKRVEAEPPKGHVLAVAFVVVS